MYCVFWEDAIKAMGGNRGKLAAMAGHAFLHTWWESEAYAPPTKDMCNLYREGLAKKVVLRTDDIQTIYSLQWAYKGRCSVVIDRGLTVFKEPTLCCIGIGPILKDEANEELKALKVLI